MDFREVIAVKRDGGRLSQAQIDAFLGAYVAGDVPDYLASALLMAIYLRGMEGPELGAWTRGMTRSGRVLDLARLDRPAVDKHSTGGVGDKVSLPLAPAVAACGAAVPMISGRGLGHTGGTLDKLEAIPGFTTELDEERIVQIAREVGAVIAGQTEDLVPADRKLYALRDVTGLVASVPLIASSILSKKIAEGISGLVLDVKFGSGAFLPEIERGEELAETMLAIARETGLAAAVFQTSMTRPLGRTVGHTLEIDETLDCLEGEGPPELRELVVLFGGEMLRLAGLVATDEQGRAHIRAVLDDGRAREVFGRLVAAQGGDVRALEDRSLLPRAPDREVLRAERAGKLAFDDVRQLGLAVGALGGGRRAIGDAIDPAVGLVFLATEGDELARGDAICEIHHREGRGLDEAGAALERAIAVRDEVSPSPLVLAHRGARG